MGLYCWELTKAAIALNLSIYTYLPRRIKIPADRLTEVEFRGNPPKGSLSLLAIIVLTYLQTCGYDENFKKTISNWKFLSP